MSLMTGEADKAIVEGTHRTRPLHETLEWIEPMAPRFGITRVADVTGLDHIGLPVVMVCRPNSRNLSVSQGKGASLAAAKASGLMESIETWHAEHVDGPLRLDTWRRLRDRVDLVDIELLPRPIQSAFGPDRRVPWIAGRGLASGREAWLPFELVDLDLSTPRVFLRHCFLSSSNGLASGNHIMEATSHALCEVIERDAINLWHLLDDDATDATRIDLDSVTDPLCRSVLELYESRDVAVEAWDATGDLGVACFVARVEDRNVNWFRRISWAEGSGCHPDAGIALLRALTEAAQSRLTAISGSRDDLPLSRYRELRSAAMLEWRSQGRSGVAPGRRFDAVPSWSTSTIDADVAGLVDSIVAAGLPEPVAVDLTDPTIGIPVVKVVAPGLEPKAHAAQAVPGPRSRARMAALAAEREARR